MNNVAISGWCDFLDSYGEAVAHFPNGSLFIEVGAYLGLSTIGMAGLIKESGKDIRFVSIDTCKGTPNERGAPHQKAVDRGGGTFAGELHKNLIKYKVDEYVSLLITDSIKASRLFPDNSIDFVYLDSSHEYNHVKNEIKAWLPKVKRGGWLAGDDYCDVWPEIKQAVQEELPGFTPWGWDSWRYIVN